MKFIPLKIDYLKAGNEKQKKAYEALIKLGIIDKLQKFNPALAGTIPLAIDVESSDLDIICESQNLKDFESIVRSHFETFQPFHCSTQNVRGIDSFVASFKAHGFEFEIFCQPVPVQNQFAMIHLNIESRLLDLAGKTAKIEIQKLKQQGLKTEPAFAKYFQIEGDPYLELVKIADFSDRQLLALIEKKAPR